MEIKNRVIKSGCRIPTKCFLLMLLITLASTGLRAQTSAIGGKVTSAEDHLPVAGASVSVKGTTMGTVTDADGAYSLNAPADAVLVFSFIGLKTQEVPVTGRTTINLLLENEDTGLDEVVVVGYGSQKKSKFIGSGRRNWFGAARKPADRYYFRRASGSGPQSEH